MADNTEQAGSALVSLDRDRGTARLLAPVQRSASPLVPVPRLHRDLLIKPESLFQPTGSFKHAAAHTPPIQPGWPGGPRARGSSPIPAGNHGHAVAYAAALLGVRAGGGGAEHRPHEPRPEAIKYSGAELVTVAPTMAARVAATRRAFRRARVRGDPAV